MESAVVGLLSHIEFISDIKQGSRLDNFQNLFNGEYDVSDAIIIHHLQLALGGFIIGIFFTFMIMNIIARFGRISNFLMHSDIIGIDRGGSTKFAFKRPRCFSEFCMLVISYIYIRFTGKTVCIINPKVKLIVNIIWFVFIFAIIYISIYLINSISTYTPKVK